ncbi:MAG: AEC family transporter, partial [Ignavibacteriae bacterium]
LIIKLGIAPAVGMIMIGLLIADAHVARATLLEAAMPTMVLTMVFAERYGLDEEILAQAIVFSTVVAMLTLPFIAS